MKTQFLNTPMDCQWLRETHLAGVPLHPFQSFILYGNEDAPDKLHLFASADPLESDPYVLVDFTEGPPVYCTVKDVPGK